MPDSWPAGVAFSEFVRLLSPAMREAASLARSLEGRVQNMPKLEEHSAVKQALTEADKQTQEIILRALLDNFPRVCLAAEEDTASVARFPSCGEARVIIDPIDGTLNSYLESKGPYSVIVGLEVRGRYEAGLVAMPREGLFFEASRGGGARIEVAGRSHRNARIEAGGERIMVGHDTPESVRAHLRQRGYEITPASGGAVAVAPLVRGVRAGLRWKARELGISIRGRVGALISREAGALVRDESGASFPGDSSTRANALLVAKNEEDIALLRDALSAGLAAGDLVVRS